MITCDIDREAAALLHEAYWKKNWAVKAVAKEQITKEIEGQLWLFNPISKFWYSLRTEKDIFSTLVQGSASYCFDRWGLEIYNERPQFTAQFHDEFVFTVRKGHRTEMEDILKTAIESTNEILNLNRQLDISIQWGDKYSDIH